MKDTRDSADTVINHTNRASRGHASTSSAVSTSGTASTSSSSSKYSFIGTFLEILDMLKGFTNFPFSLGAASRQPKVKKIAPLMAKSLASFKNRRYK